MALSESTKEILRLSTSRLTPEEKQELAIVGPAVMLESALRDCRDLYRPSEDDPNNVFTAEVQAHRQEAEQFLAGLLGMM